MNRLDQVAIHGSPMALTDSYGGHRGPWIWVSVVSGSTPPLRASTPPTAERTRGTPIGSDYSSGLMDDVSKSIEEGGGSSPIIACVARERIRVVSADLAVCRTFVVRFLGG